MNTKNRTELTEFILLGFSEDLNTNIILFVVFLLLFLLSINTNCLILSLIFTNTNLQIPMYFFLSILAFMDLCLTSSIIPKLLVDFISGHNLISLAACTAQFYIASLTGGTECLLLAFMAYDGYVAICRPLHYPVMMRWSNCYRMAVLLCILIVIVFLLSALGNSGKLCYPNQINHFMCEGLALLQLACDDVSLIIVGIFIICFIANVLPFLLIIASYIYILYSVLKIRSAGRAKAFSTCTSHVIVVVSFYGPLVAMYFGTSSKYSTDYGKYISLFSYIICPTMNPLIYCLNNKDIKEAIRKKFFKFEL